MGDLQTYLASSSGEENGHDSGAEALRKLVKGDDGGSSDFPDMDASGDESGGEVLGDMEATFSLKAEELEGKLSEKSKLQGSKASKVHTLEEDKPQSAWEKYLEKRKAKRKEHRTAAKEQRKARQNTGDNDADKDTLEATEGDLELLAGVEDDEKGFNHRGPQRAAHSKGRKAKDDGESFKVDVDDSRFASIFSTQDFEIDPTNPEFRRSAGMNDLLKKKRKRKASTNESVTVDRAQSSKHQDAAQTHDAPIHKGTGFGGLQLFGNAGRSQPTKVAQKQPTEFGSLPDRDLIDPKHMVKKKKRRKA